MTAAQQTRLTKQQVLALRGIRLPLTARKLMRAAGIYCEPAISIEYQRLAKQYALWARESGGATAQIGAYCGFVGPQGEPMGWLNRIDSIGRNGLHAAVLAPHLIRVQVFRRDSLFELLVTRHEVVSSQQRTRPSLVNTILFHGTNGTLLPEQTDTQAQFRAEILPMFRSQAGEVMAVPEVFAAGVRGALAGACCVGCNHCHLLQPEIPHGTSQVEGSQMRVVSRPSNDRDSGITIERVLADPAASFWLKGALRSALERDPVDAINDAEVLAKLLDQRCQMLLTEDFKQTK